MIMSIKWLLLGDHPDFATREPKYVVSVEIEGDYVYQTILSYLCVLKPIISPYHIFILYFLIKKHYRPV